MNGHECLYANKNNSQKDFFYDVGSLITMQENIESEKLDFVNTKDILTWNNSQILFPVLLSRSNRRPASTISCKTKGPLAIGFLTVERQL